MDARNVDLEVALRGLDRMIEMHVALFELTRREAEILDAEEGVDELIRLAGRKSAIMATLNAVDGELRPFKREWRARRETYTAKQRAAVDERLSALLEIIGCILLVETRCEEALEEMGVADVAPAPATKNALGAYAASARVPAGVGSIDHCG
jgi:hypothetical protein